MLTVYLGNKFIRAVSGDVSGSRLHVQKVYKTADNNGAILNGTIVDEEALFALLKSFWEENNLPKKDVYLVLNSNQFNTKGMRVPTMNSKKMMAYLEREFSGVERMEDPVYGYFQLQKPDQANKMQKIVAMATPRNYALQFVGLFKRIGIQLSGIESVGASMNRLLGMLTPLQGKTCILQFVEDMNLTNVLWYNGNIETSNRKRLFSDPGTPGYAVEIARAVSNLTQFAKAQNIEQLITHVFVAGLSAEDYEVYEDGVRNISDQLTIGRLEGGDNIIMDKKLEEEDAFSENALAIGGMVKKELGVNIADQLKYTQEEQIARNKRKRLLIPSITVAAILAVASLVLLFRNIYLGRQLKALEDYNNDPQVIKTCAEYDVLSAQINAANGIAGGLQHLTDTLDTYPVVDSSVEAAVESCASGLVSATITGYDAATGLLNMDVKAGAAQQINQFVERISGQEIFASVDYTGYAQDSEGTWNVNVTCIMAPGEGALER